MWVCEKTCFFSGKLGMEIDSVGRVGWTFFVGKLSA